MLRKRWKHTSVAGRLAVTATAGTVLAGALMATSITAHAALPETPIMFVGSHIPAHVKSIHISPHKCKDGLVDCDLKNEWVKCVDVTTGQDVHTGVSVGGATGYNAVAFLAYAGKECPQQELQWTPAGTTGPMQVPEELPTKNWWVELDQILIMSPKA